MPTRSERILKLGRAFRRWRGSFHPETKEWIRKPNPNAEADVVRWLETFPVDVNQRLAQLSQFKSWPEYYAFVKELENLGTTTGN